MKLELEEDWDEVLVCEEDDDDDDFCEDEDEDELLLLFSCAFFIILSSLCPEEVLPKILSSGDAILFSSP